MSVAVQPYLQVIDDNGDPIVDAFVYFGQPDQDPVANPKAITDPNGTPISNPQRTNGFGLTVNPVNLSGSYSLAVHDSDDVPIPALARANFVGLGGSTGGGGDNDLWESVEDTDSGQQVLVINPVPTGATAVVLDYTQYVVGTVAASGNEPIFIPDGPDFQFNPIFARIGVRIVKVTASGDYTAASDVKAVEFLPIGGGGGGGGVFGSGGGTAVASEAGSGAGWCKQYVTAPSGTFTIVVGIGGAKGASGDNAGTNGGATTVVGTDVNLSAGGGLGGSGHTGISGSQAGGAKVGGTSTGGDVNGSGLPSSHKGIVSGNVSSFSISGSCPVIGGGVLSQSGSAGVDATFPGEGGGASHSNSSGSVNTGGNGFRGEVQITEYF